MRLSKALGSLVAAGLMVMAFSAQAGDEELVNVSCKDGNVTATAKSPWHVNKEAPWKWDKGDRTSLDEGAAKFHGAKCEGTIKAFVCQGTQMCKGPIAVPVK